MRQHGRKVIVYTTWPPITSEVSCCELPRSNDGVKILSDIERDFTWLTIEIWGQKVFVKNEKESLRDGFKPLNSFSPPRRWQITAWSSPRDYVCGGRGRLSVYLVFENKIWVVAEWMCSGGSSSHLSGRFWKRLPSSYRAFPDDSL